MQDMIAAAVADQVPEAVMVRMLANPAVAFLQVRSVTRGCFTMKVERARWSLTHSGDGRT